MTNEKATKSTFRMNIVTALNSRYVRYACVMLTSLFMNNPDAEVHVYFLHSSLSDSEQAVLARLAESYGNAAHFIAIDRNLFPSSLPTTQMWSLETYFRLTLPDLMPEDVDRLLYLDVDMIIDKPLGELYSTGFEGKLFCACPDMTAVFPFPDSRNDIFKEHIAGGFTYFNAGMMLWNMTELRGRYCFADYMRLAEQLDYRMAAPDQDLLNYLHWGQVKFLDEYRYNLFSRFAYNRGIHYADVKKETVIIHFAGFKPWEGEYVHYDIEQLWWDYARLTPFYQELLEDFLHGCLMLPTVPDTLKKLSEDNERLREELGKSGALCQKLLTLLEKQGF